MLLANPVNQLLGVVLGLVVLELLLVQNDELIDDLEDGIDVFPLAREDCDGDEMLMLARGRSWLELEADHNRRPLLRGGLTADDPELHLLDHLLVVRALGADEGTQVLRIYIDVAGDVDGGHSEDIRY